MSWLRTSLFLFVYAVGPWPLMLQGGIGSLFDTQIQQQVYGIDWWREGEGLPQAGIRAITQTRDGYLWLGTDNGLIRFNGTGFTGFTVETGSLKDNEVWALQEDADGALWIGTYGGGLTRLQDGRFTTFTMADGLPDDVVTQITKDGQGNLWMSTPHGACRYSHGKFVAFTTADGLSGNYLGAIAASEAYGIYAATAAQVHRFQGGRFEAIAGITEHGDGTIEKLVSARDGSLWVGFSNGTVKSWKDGKLKSYRWPHSQTPQVTLLYEDTHGVIWAGLDQKLFKLAGGGFEPVLFDEGKADLGILYSMFVDREGSIWLGFQSDGLGRLRVKQLFNLSTREGLPNESARSVFQDREGAVWIGTARGFATYSGTRVTSYTELDGVPLGPVRSFAEDQDGTMWIAAGNELLKMGPGGPVVRVPGWKSSSRIEVIYQDPKGGILVGTDGDGLFELKDSGFVQLTVRDGLSSNHVRALSRDSRNALWISTFGGGVTRYQDGRFTHFGPSEGLAGNRVSTVHEDEAGAIWFATRGGLTRLKDGRFFSYPPESGLFSNFVYAILDDGRGNFWFSSAQGIFRTSKSDLNGVAEGRLRKVTSVSYGVRDGMKTRACNVGNQPTAWKLADGSLLFSSMKGVVVVSPGHITASHLVPPVYVESVKVNKQRQQLNTEPHLKPGSGEFEINYAALSYLDPEKMQFKYMLEGFDTGWVNAGARRLAYYANLPAGHYRFRVIAGNVDGPWNETGASFSFDLSPHWYQTWAFLGIAATGTVLLAWLLFRLRMHELKARYSAVLGERNRISRDIHDTFAQNLSGIALQLDSIAMQLDEVPSELKKSLDQACDLTRYSLAEARRAMSDLRSDELESLHVATALPAIAGRMAAGASVQTSVSVVGTPQPLSAVLDKNLLRVFQEAMANALKHSKARNIFVELKYDAAKLALQVRDDGCGFDTDKAISLGNGHYGLIGMRERAERIGGFLTLKSSPGEGTELRIEVPFSAAGPDRRR